MADPLALLADIERLVRDGFGGHVVTDKIARLRAALAPKRTPDHRSLRNAIEAVLRHHMVNVRIDEAADDMERAIREHARTCPDAEECPVAGVALPVPVPQAVRDAFARLSRRIDGYGPMSTGEWVCSGCSVPWLPSPQHRPDCPVDVLARHLLTSTPTTGKEGP